MKRSDVPTQIDGQLYFIGTELKPDEAPKKRRRSRSRKRRTDDGDMPAPAADE
jgi:hypothetical protein